MLQEDELNSLTKQKEMIDAGALNEEELANEKATVMSNSPREPLSQPKPAITESTKEQVTMASSTETSALVGQANVDLPSAIVLPLGIFAIIVSLISSLLTNLADPESVFNTGYYDYSDAYTYSQVSGICDFLAAAAELILWICAFKKLSTMREGERLGRIPLWTYLYLGANLLMGVVSIADPMTETPVYIIPLLAGIAFGYVAYISILMKQASPCLKKREEKSETFVFNFSAASRKRKLVECGFLFHLVFPYCVRFARKRQLLPC